MCKVNFENIVIKSTPAPRRTTSSPNVSHYGDFFAKMKKGNWFVISSDDKNRFNAAGSTYLKGRFSLYRHPTLKNKYVFQLVK
jgi:hypothetical protein